MVSCRFDYKHEDRTNQVNYVMGDVHQKQGLCSNMRVTHEPTYEQYILYQLDFNFQVNSLICRWAKEFTDASLVHTRISTASIKMKCVKLILRLFFSMSYCYAIPSALTVAESRTYCPDDPLESNSTV